MKRTLSLLAALAFPLMVRAADASQVLDALQAVETGGMRNPALAVGDGGRSRGWLQISRPYYQDALPILRATYGAVPAYEVAVADREWSRRIVMAYWSRYCPAALAGGNAEVLARVHNGSATGMKKTATKGYWLKVKKVLAS